MPRICQVVVNSTAEKKRRIESFLSKVPLIAYLSDEERSKIADSIGEFTYQAGEYIIRQVRRSRTRAATRAETYHASDASFSAANEAERFALRWRLLSAHRRMCVCTSSQPHRAIPTC